MPLVNYVKEEMQRAIMRLPQSKGNNSASSSTGHHQIVYPFPTLP